MKATSWMETTNAHGDNEIFKSMIQSLTEHPSIKVNEKNIISNTLISFVGELRAGNMTTQATKLLVLGPFRPFLLIPTLYDLKSFRGKWSRILSNACKTAVYTILWLVTLIFIASDFCYCYLHRGDLVLIALPLSILLLGIQVICHFVSIRLKSNEIDEVIGRLQEIVERSKFQWNLTLIGYGFDPIQIRL